MGNTKGMIRKTKETRIIYNNNRQKQEDNEKVEDSKKEHEKENEKEKWESYQETLHKQKKE